MIYLPDTNACIVYLKGRNDRLRDRMDTMPQRYLRLCSVVKGELLAGTYRYDDPPARMRRLARFFAPFESLPFDDAAAEEYGPVRAHLQRSGRLIGPNDMLIAAIALANDCTVVTHNTSEFGRVPGLSVEDWEA